jgi:hypothetical protein
MDSTINNQVNLANYIFSKTTGSSSEKSNKKLSQKRKWGTTSPFQKEIKKTKNDNKSDIDVPISSEMVELLGNVFNDVNEETGALKDYVGSHLSQPLDSTSLFFPIASKIQSKYTAEKTSTSDDPNNRTANSFSNRSLMKFSNNFGESGSLSKGHVDSPIDLNFSSPIDMRNSSGLYGNTASSFDKSSSMIEEDMIPFSSSNHNNSNKLSTSSQIRSASPIRLLSSTAGSSTSQIAKKTPQLNDVNLQLEILYLKRKSAIEREAGNLLLANDYLQKALNLLFFGTKEQPKGEEETLYDENGFLRYERLGHLSEEISSTNPYDLLRTIDEKYFLFDPAVHSKAGKIQRYYRRYLRKRIDKANRLITIIRGFLARNRYKKLLFLRKQCAILLQRRFRIHLKRMNDLATKIKQWYKIRKIVKDYQKKLFLYRAARTIQKAWRGYIGRKKAALIKLRQNSVSCIQRNIRRFFIRNHRHFAISCIHRVYFLSVRKIQTFIRKLQAKQRCQIKLIMEIIRNNLRNEKERIVLNEMNRLNKIKIKYYLKTIAGKLHAYFIKRKLLYKRQVMIQAYLEEKENQLQLLQRQAAASSANNSKKSNNNNNNNNKINNSKGNLPSSSSAPSDPVSSSLSSPMIPIVSSNTAYSFITPDLITLLDSFDEFYDGKISFSQFLLLIKALKIFSSLNEEVIFYLKNRFDSNHLNIVYLSDFLSWFDSEEADIMIDELNHNSHGGSGNLDFSFSFAKQRIKEVLHLFPFSSFLSEKKQKAREEKLIIHEINGKFSYSYNLLLFRCNYKPKFHCNQCYQSFLLFSDFKAHFHQSSAFPSSASSSPDTPSPSSAAAAAVATVGSCNVTNLKAFFYSSNHFTDKMNWKNQKQIDYEIIRYNNELNYLSYFSRKQCFEEVVSWNSLSSTSSSSASSSSTVEEIFAEREKHLFDILFPLLSNCKNIKAKIVDILIHYIFLFETSLLPSSATSASSSASSVPLNQQGINDPHFFISDLLLHVLSKSFNLPLKREWMIHERLYHQNPHQVLSSQPQPTSSKDKKKKKEQEEPKEPKEEKNEEFNARQELIRWLNRYITIKMPFLFLSKGSNASLSDNAATNNSVSSSSIAATGPSSFEDDFVFDVNYSSLFDIFSPPSEETSLLPHSQSNLTKQMSSSAISSSSSSSKKYQSLSKGKTNSNINSSTSSLGDTKKKIVPLSSNILSPHSLVYDPFRSFSHQKPLYSSFLTVTKTGFFTKLTKKLSFLIVRILSLLKRQMISSLFALLEFRTKFPRKTSLNDDCLIEMNLTNLTEKQYNDDYNFYMKTLNLVKRKEKEIEIIGLEKEKTKEMKFAEKKYNLTKRKLERNNNKSSSSSFLLSLSPLMTKKQYQPIHPTDTPAAPSSSILIDSSSSELPDTNDQQEAVIQNNDDQLDNVQNGNEVDLEQKEKVENGKEDEPMMMMNDGNDEDFNDNNENQDNENDDDDKKKKKANDRSTSININPEVEYENEKKVIISKYSSSSMNNQIIIKSFLNENSYSFQQMMISLQNPLFQRYVASSFSFPFEEMLQRNLKEEVGGKKGKNERNDRERDLKSQVLSSLLSSFRELIELSNGNLDFVYNLVFMLYLKLSFNRRSSSHFWSSSSSSLHSIPSEQFSIYDLDFINQEISQFLSIYKKELRFLPLELTSASSSSTNPQQREELIKWESLLESLFQQLLSSKKKFILFRFTNSSLLSNYYQQFNNSCQGLFSSISSLYNGDHLRSSYLNNNQIISTNGKDIYLLSLRSQRRLQLQLVNHSLPLSLLPAEKKDINSNDNKEDVVNNDNLGLKASLWNSLSVADTMSGDFGKSKNIRSSKNNHKPKLLTPLENESSLLLSNVDQNNIDNLQKSSRGKTLRFHDNDSLDSVHGDNDEIQPGKDSLVPSSSSIKKKNTSFDHEISSFSFQWKQYLRHQKEETAHINNEVLNIITEKGQQDLSSYLWFSNKGRQSVSYEFHLLQLLHNYIQKILSFALRSIVVPSEERKRETDWKLFRIQSIFLKTDNRREDNNNKIDNDNEEEKLSASEEYLSKYLSMIIDVIIHFLDIHIEGFVDLYELLTIISCFELTGSRNHRSKDSFEDLLQDLSRLYHEKYSLINNKKQLPYGANKSCYSTSSSSSSSSSLPVDKDNFLLPISLLTEPLLRYIYWEIDVFLQHPDNRSSSFFGKTQIGFRMKSLTYQSKQLILLLYRHSTRKQMEQSLMITNFGSTLHAFDDNKLSSSSQKSLKSTRSLRGKADNGVTREALSLSSSLSPYYEMKYAYSSLIHEDREKSLLLRSQLLSERQVDYFLQTFLGKVYLRKIHKERVSKMAKLLFLNNDEFHLSASNSRKIQRSSTNAINDNDYHEDYVDESYLYFELYPTSRSLTSQHRGYGESQEDLVSKKKKEKVEQYLLYVVYLHCEVFSHSYGNYKKKLLNTELIHILSYCDAEFHLVFLPSFHSIITNKLQHGMNRKKVRWYSSHEVFQLLLSHIDIDCSYRNLLTHEKTISRNAVSSSTSLLRQLKDTRNHLLSRARQQSVLISMNLEDINVPETNYRCFVLGLYDIVKIKASNKQLKNMVSYVQNNVKGADSETVNCDEKVHIEADEQLDGHLASSHQPLHQEKEEGGFEGESFDQQQKERFFSWFSVSSDSTLITSHINLQLPLEMISYYLFARGYDYHHVFHPALEEYSLIAELPEKCDGKFQLDLKSLSLINGIVNKHVWREMTFFEGLKKRTRYLNRFRCYERERLFIEYLLSEEVLLIEKRGSEYLKEIFSGISNLTL